MGGGGGRGGGGGGGDERVSQTSFTRAILYPYLLMQLLTIKKYQQKQRENRKQSGQRVKKMTTRRQKAE